MHYLNIKKGMIQCIKYKKRNHFNKAVMKLFHSWVKRDNNVFSYLIFLEYRNTNFVIHFKENRTNSHTNTQIFTLSTYIVGVQQLVWCVVAREVSAHPDLWNIWYQSWVEALAVNLSCEFFLAGHSYCFKLDCYRPATPKSSFHYK